MPDVLTVTLLGSAGVELILSGLSFGYNQIKAGWMLLAFAAVSLALLAIGG